MPVPVWLFGLLALGYFMTFIAGGLRWVYEFLARRTAKADLQFSDHPPGLVEYPIEIVVLRQRATLGADRGLAWFENGLLHFSGGATSFTLAAEDIVAREKVRRVDPYRNLPADAIRLARPGPLAAVRLMPLNGFRRIGFGIALRRFLKEGAAVKAVRQWPPLHEFGALPSEPSVPRTASELGRAAAADGVSEGVIRA